MAQQITSPKLRGLEWYQYYAGYSTTFASEVLDQLGIPPAGTVLDPWNGSGTTTSVAHSLGFGSIGLDLNPALVVVGRARLLSSDLVQSIRAIAEDLVAHASVDGVHSEPAQDPLSIWLGPKTAAQVRRLESVTNKVLVGGDVSASSHPRNVGEVSSLAALFYVAIFAVVRSLVADAYATNPTWVSTAVKRRRRASHQTIDSMFLGAVDRLTTRLGSKPAGLSNTLAVINEATSTALPLDDNSIDAVLTSPPYATRIDYVKATLPELAVLGYGKDAIRSLRNRMIGTPTITGLVATGSQVVPRAQAFLGAVSDHPSKASSTYYLTFFKQYLDGIQASISELTRVARPHSRLAMVVQDSYYKEVHLDLAAIVGEVLDAAGWTPIGRYDFRHRARSAINPRAAYGAPLYRTESVIMAQLSQT